MKDVSALRQAFVETLLRRQDPLVSRVCYPWWVGILGFTPREEQPHVIGTCDDRSIRKIIAALTPLLRSRAKLPPKIAERLALRPGASLGDAAALMTKVLEEEAQAWIEGREPDYSSFPRGLYDPSRELV
jgi:hypothetical protein